MTQEVAEWLQAYQVTSSELVFYTSDRENIFLVSGMLCILVITLNGKIPFNRVKKTPDTDFAKLLGQLAAVRMPKPTFCGPFLLHQ